MIVSIAIHTDSSESVPRQLLVAAIFKCSIKTNKHLIQYPNVKKSAEGFNIRRRSKFSVA